MINEKKLYLCEQHTQRLYAIAVGMAQEAARAGNFGRGYAVVAHEALRAADNLQTSVVGAKFEGEIEQLLKQASAYAMELFYLSINAELEAIRICETDNTMSNNKAITVFIAELQKLAMALNELGEKRPWNQPSVLVEAANPIKSSAMRHNFFKFAVGGVVLVESALNVMEVLHRRSDDLAGDTIKIRGLEIPIINLHKCFGIAPIGDVFAVIIVQSEKDKYVAIPADDLDVSTIFRSNIGLAVRPAAGHPLKDYARECWDAVGGGQMVFLDWVKLLA